jgi:hypothetical protein
MLAMMCDESLNRRADLGGRVAVNVFALLRDAVGDWSFPRHPSFHLVSPPLVMFSFRLSNGLLLVDVIVRSRNWVSRQARLDCSGLHF